MLTRLNAPGTLSPRPLGWGLCVTRSASGLIFIAFGAGKFVNHVSETSSFRAYGLPWANLFAGGIGVLELVGGFLLIAGLATRLVAFLLAGDMIGAIVLSGIARGETISLTLAPLMLVALVALSSGDPVASRSTPSYACAALAPAAIQGSRPRQASARAPVAVCNWSCRGLTLIDVHLNQPPGART